MSDNHGAHGNGGGKSLIPSGDTIRSGGKLLTIGNALKLIGLVAVITWGVWRILVQAGYETYQTLKPQFVGAAQELGQYAPPVGEMSITLSGRQFTLFGGRAAGEEYARLTGNSGAIPGSSQNADGTTTVAASVDELLPVYQGQVPEDPAAKSAQYESLKQQFLILTGGIQFPDFAMLKAYDVATLRQVLAAMKATGVDLVVPNQWAALLEAEVEKRYVNCFAAKNIECLREWGELQTEVLINPAGLGEWIDSVLADEATLTSLLDFAVNTNAQDIVRQKLDAAYQNAITQRTNDACIRVEANSAQAIDWQWCLVGETVTVTVDENLDLPKEVGGNRGVLDDDDEILITSSKGARRIPTVVAVQAMPTLSTDGGSFQFAELPALWNSTVNPWRPGQPLP